MIGSGQSEESWSNTEFVPYTLGKSSPLTRFYLCDVVAAADDAATASAARENRRQLAAGQLN